MQSLVVDHGTYFIKGGFGGDEYSRGCFPSVAGRPSPDVTHTYSQRLYYAGDSALKNPKMIPAYPIQHGIITNWDDMKAIWWELFCPCLGAWPEDNPTVFTEPPFNPKENREKLSELMFETYNAPAIYISLAQTLAVIGAGRTSGIVIDCGYDDTHVVPVFDGHAISQKNQKLELAGRALNDFLKKSLMERLPTLSIPKDDVIREIKEKICYLSLDLEKEIKNSELEKIYELPDGQIISIGQERFQIPEALFQPSLVGLKSDGIPKIISDTINQCDSDLRNELYGNVILCGGSTLIPRFEARLLKELASLAPESETLRVIASPQRQNLAWRGGSILAALSTFEERWFSAEEYIESGASAIHRKCI